MSHRPFNELREKMHPAAKANAHAGADKEIEIYHAGQNANTTPSVPLTRDFRETIVSRCEKDPEFVRALLDESEEADAKAEQYGNALRRIAGELGEFADADGNTMVKKIRFFRGELSREAAAREKAEGEVVEVIHDLRAKLDVSVADLRRVSASEEATRQRECEAENYANEVTEKLSQMTDRAEKAEARLIHDRDGKPVSQGAFNALECRYYEYGERMGKAEKAEGALCRARDYLLTIKSSVENVAGAFIGYIDLDAMINDLNESSPCPHEARVKELEEQLKKWNTGWEITEDDVRRVMEAGKNNADEMHRLYQVELAAHSSTTRNLRDAEAELAQCKETAQSRQVEIERLRKALNIDREDVGRIMHESWTRTKRAQGFHHTSECYCLDRYESNGPCSKCHADLIPWEQLPEAQKDINRHAFDDVLAELRRRAGKEE